MIRTCASLLWLGVFAACAKEAGNATDSAGSVGDSSAIGGASLSSAPSVPGTVAMADVAGARLWYEVAGQGEPVILLHGGNLDARMWDTQFALLSRTHQVVRYDLR